MMLKSITHSVSIFILAIIFCTSQQNSNVLAQSESAYDLIATVNALRASRGLAPYSINNGLMGYAQQHADYMASIQNATHTHSDGSVAWQIGIQENIAVGTEGIVNSSYVVYQIWSDAIHWHVMVDFASGEVGAGIARGSDGNLYYSLNVRAGNELPPVPQPTSASGTVVPPSGGASNPTPDLIALVIKSTPAADGSITHTVGYGQSLWSIAIAYDIKIDQIRSLNGMAPDSLTIYAGQPLVIQLPSTATATLEPGKNITPTKTEVPTRTTAPVTATQMATITSFPTALPTFTPTAIPIANSNDSQNNIAMLVMGISLVGLTLVILFGFVKTRTIK